MGSPILGLGEQRGWGRTLSKALCLMTEGADPLGWGWSGPGLGERGRVGGCAWVEVGVGTTQEECKVLIISGLSEALEEVLLSAGMGWGWGERASFRCSRWGGRP